MANVYADNAQNRKLGRVGMPRGSMPVSADGTYSPAKTYVDNSFNRRHGRVGLPHGSMVVTKENDSVNRLGRKYNDRGICASRIFNDSGIDVSHHSPDTCYSSIRSSTNLHLKTNWSTVKHDIPDRQQNTQREDLRIRYIRQQEEQQLQQEEQQKHLRYIRQQEQQQEQQKHLRYIRKEEQQKHLEQEQQRIQEQQTRKLKQLRQQEHLEQEQQHIQEQQTRKLKQLRQQEQQKHLEQEQQRIQEQQTRKLKQLRQQEQQKHLEQEQQRMQEQQTRKLKQLRQQEQQCIQEQHTRKLQKLRQQEQLLQEHQRIQEQQHIQEQQLQQVLQLQREQPLRTQQLQQEQLLQEQQCIQEQVQQLLQVQQEHELQKQQLQQEQLLQEHQRIQEQQHIQEQQLQQVLQLQREQPLRTQQLQQEQLLQEQQCIQEQVQQLLQVQQEHELQKQQYEIDCPDIWSSINHEQVYEFDSKTEIVWRSPETQVHVQPFNNFSQRDSVLVQNIGPGVNNAASVPEDDDNDGETLDLYQRESDKSGLLYNDSGIDTSMYGPFDSTIVTKYNPVRRRKECNVNFSSSPAYQGPRQIHKKSDVDCKIPNMHSGAISGSKQKHRKSKDKYMKHSNPLLRFPDEDIDVEILYGTHLEDNESDFNGFEYIHKISEGWFSEIHKAKWKNTVVAVKQINLQRATEQKLKDFKEEILLFRTLNHPNVVKCIASFTAKPNLCIVMEYMQTCLYNALYTKDKIKFLESGKIKIIQDIALGLSYLHNSNIAHCNIMSKNIILNDIHSQAPVAKITDFSLSMKDDKRTSSQRSTRISRYSAPEVLRGDLPNVTHEQMADTYSYALVVFEIICEEEPFHTLDYQQLKQQVCDLGLTPIKSSDIDLDSTVLQLLQECWDREPWLRPTAKEITQYTLRIDRLILPRYSRSQECLEYWLCVGFILFFISIFCVVFQ